MKKRLLFSISLFVLFSAFNVNTVTCQNESLAIKQDDITLIKLGDFEKEAANFVDKTVKVEGIVDHICEHGGKKMFLVDEKSDARVKVTTNDNMAAFKQKLIGETVEVTGVVKEISVDEDFLFEMEQKIKSGSKEKGEKLHIGDGEHNGEAEDRDEDAEMNKVNNLRNMLKESGKDHISFYSIEAVKFRVL